MPAAAAAANSKARAPRRGWAASAEEASLGMREAVLVEARRNYAALARPAQRMQIVREIALTRGPELTLAYSNLIMVSAGFRRCSPGGQEVLTREPCVVFVVRRKWKKGTAHDGDIQHLPPHLLAHATDETGRRVLVAVPTDVQLATRYAAARAQGDRAIHVQPANTSDSYGVLTALVRLSVGEPPIRALSALHVLTPDFSAAVSGPSPDAAVEIADGIPQRQPARLIGTSLAEGGVLVPGPGISFDAQLIGVSDPQSVATLLQGVPLSTAEPYVADPDRYDELVLAEAEPLIEILIPDNHPLAPGGRPRMYVKPAGDSTHAYPIPYENVHGQPMQVQHRHLIHLDFCGGPETMKGDSGSPVVLWREDGACTLVGMHVAGSEGLSHVLPAWLLMNAESYLGTLPEGCALSLETP